MVGSKLYEWHGPPFSWKYALSAEAEIRKLAKPGATSKSSTRGTERLVPTRVVGYSAWRRDAHEDGVIPAASFGAQWLDFRTPGIPRTADGKPNLAAPAPKTLDGKPDLSGI